MSAESFVVYFGLRFALDPDEVESLELRSDPRILAARKARLDYHWGNFGGLDAKYLLYVGYELGVFGVENSIETRFTGEDLQAIMEQTKAALIETGLNGNPELHLAYEPDI